MRIGILGSGLMGGKLGTSFARAGHEVVFSYAQSEEKLKTLVAAFNTVPSEVLFGVYETRGEADRPSLVYCGDDRKSKELAAGLIRDAGFDPVDAGPLRIARYTEPFALLVGQMAYDGKGGPDLAYWFERLGQAKRR